MLADRCAHLIAVTMANKIEEVWISNQPILIFTYVSQYAPTIARRSVCVCVCVSVCVYMYLTYLLSVGLGRGLETGD